MKRTQLQQLKGGDHFRLIAGMQYHFQTGNSGTVIGEGTRWAYWNDVLFNNRLTVKKAHKYSVEVVVLNGGAGIDFRLLFGGATVKPGVCTEVVLEAHRFRFRVFDRELQTKVFSANTTSELYEWIVNSTHKVNRVDLFIDDVTTGTEVELNAFAYAWENGPIVLPDIENITT